MVCPAAFGRADLPVRLPGPGNDLMCAIKQGAAKKGGAAAPPYRGSDQPLTGWINLDFPRFAGFFVGGRADLPVRLPGLGNNLMGEIEMGQSGAKKGGKAARQGRPTTDW